MLLTLFSFPCFIHCCSTAVAAAMLTLFLLLCGSYRASQDLPLYVEQWVLNILYFYSHMDCGYKSLHSIGKTFM